MEVVSGSCNHVYGRNALSGLTGSLKKQKTLCDASLVDLIVGGRGHRCVFGGLLRFSVAALSIIFLRSLAI